MKVLVTGAGAVLGQAIIKSIKLIKSDEKIEIISCDPNPLAVGLFWSDKQYRIPLAKDINYMSEIYIILEKEKPELIFIGTDIELGLFSKHKKDIQSKFGSITIVSNENVISIGDDKWKTYSYLKENGFDTPNSSLVSGVEEFLKYNKFPLIVKPRVGARSKDVYLAKNTSELTEYIKKVENPIIQEYLDSNDEFTAGVIYFRDDSKASIVMNRTLKDGNTFTARPIEYSYVNEYLENLTKSIGSLGPINYQFRIIDGKIKIFEINSRFSGTTHFRALSNFNEVKMVIEYYMYNKKVIQPKISTDISILRYYDEIVVTKT